MKKLLKECVTGKDGVLSFSELGALVCLLGLVAFLVCVVRAWGDPLASGYTTLLIVLLGYLTGNKAIYNIPFGKNKETD